MQIERAQPGGTLDPSADTWNAFCDATDDYFRRRGQRENPPDLPGARGDVILLQNDAGEDRYRLDVLGIGGILVKPSENWHDWANRMAFHGELPTVADHYGRWGILLEDIRVGGIGRALIGGISPVRVRMAEEWHSFADVSEGETVLGSSGGGSAQLLYVQPPAERDTSGLAWCIARIGLPAIDVPRLCAVVGCDYDQVSGSLIVTCVPLRSTSMSYDPEDPIQLTAWAGIDPIIVADDIVVLKPIRPMEMNPEIRFHAEPVISVPRSMLDLPNMDDLTAYTEPAVASIDTDICAW